MSASVQGRSPTPRPRARHAAALVAACAALASPAAHAIPSPDLVVNLSASVAQLLGLLSVVFGGVAMRTRGRRGARAKASGLPRAALLGGLGLLALSLVGNALQYARALDARTDRLHTNLVRKSVENGETVGDTSLKTLSFSDQLEHPLGISTETLDEWLEAGTPVNLIDVREDEEYESGRISGTHHVRYPDVLARSGELLPDAELVADAAEGTLPGSPTRTVLLCYSGNRSSELCEELTAQGKSCSFMVGGYEKWMTEARPVEGGAADDGGELRAIADYPNREVLLDTPDVHALVAEEGAEFVDVRYPDDFVADHLPGAHNLTMRALPTDALDERIAALPDAPLVAACYDKRSCFYSEVIGLRLTRAGKDYRGRYTVPHEYYLPSAGGERAHVAAWRASNEKLTAASLVTRPARALVDRLADAFGGPVAGLLALVVLVRLVLSPLAAKAERDTRVQRSLAGRVARLADDFEDDPRGRSRATLELYAEHGIRPVANFASSMLQLFATLVFFGAVTRAAAGWPGPLLWAESATAPDTTLALPVAASVLFAAVLWLQVRPATALSRGLVALAVAFVAWLLHGLAIAASLYLALAMGALVVQSLALLAIGRRRGWDVRGRERVAVPAAGAAGGADAGAAGRARGAPPAAHGLVPLERADAEPEVTGRKAARLAALLRAGFDVPPGFVVGDVLGARLAAAPPEAPESVLSSAERRALDAAWKALGAKRVAVRSSGADEDGGDASFAGVYESILGVERAGLAEAVRAVRASFASTRNDSYRGATDERVGPASGTAPGAAPDTSPDTSLGGASAGTGGGVLVQAMVDARFAGVLFTEHPATTGAMLVEVVAGLGEGLVGGTVTPDTYAFGRLTGALWPARDQVPPALDLAPLLALGREVEALFDRPQDIEWAFADGRFQLLQARDITRSAAGGDALGALAERDRARLIAELAGRRRRPRRGPGSASPDAPVLVQNELSELLPRPTPFSFDLMSRLWEAGGATDIACRELGVPYEVHRHSVPFVTTVLGWTYVNREEEARRVGKGPGALASFRLARDAEAVQAAYVEEVVPRHRAEMLERNAIALESLSLDVAIRLLGGWTERFVATTYVEAERINVAAGFHLAAAREKLAAAKLEPAEWLGADAESVPARAMALLAGAADDPSRVGEFLAVYGHRAPLDWELAAPRYAEDPSLVERQIRLSGGGRRAGAANEPDARAAAGRPLDALPDQRVLRVAVGRARAFQTLKEDAKHDALIELAQIRRLLLAIGRLSGLGARVFQLRIDEVASLGDPERAAATAALADARAAEALARVPARPPASLSAAALERVDLVTGELPGESVSGELAGQRVAGRGAVTGRVRVVLDPEAIDALEPGEILVARMTDPTWYPAFDRARGIVTEIGGWLSHAAIVAREFDLAAIVGVDGACRRLSTGDVVTLGADGTIEVRENRRASGTVPGAAAGAGSGAAFGTAGVASGAFRLPVRHTAPLERRAMKGALGDRRSIVRMTAGGEPERDRRAANRLRNLSVYRGAARRTAAAGTVPGTRGRSGGARDVA